MLSTPPRSKLLSSQSVTRRVPRLVLLASLSALACDPPGGFPSHEVQSRSLVSCAFTVTQNVYDGPNYWGTMAFKNGAASSVSGYSVEFDVPVGAHCTNDAVPPGAVLSPLTGTGTSAHTTSNHCKFTWATATLAAGATTKPFNYSTDSTAFAAAKNVVITSPSCSSGTGGTGGMGGTGGTTGTGGATSTGGTTGTGGATSTGGATGTGGATSTGGTTGTGGASTGGTTGTGGATGGSSGAHPFGSHTFQYASGTILPSGSQATLDAATATFYGRWKQAYVKQGCGGYYVRSGGGTGSDVGDEVSEGHGYGMVITALMAGQDPDAKKIFDGMYTFFRKFPSSNQADLMGWTVDVAGGCKFPTGTSDSATDGDLDIAFSLLLADKQWGSGGAINYLAEAKKVIAAIKRGDVNPTTHLTNLGDWAASNDFSTRPSDFMQDHFRAFGRATGDAAWTSTVEAIYSLETKIQNGFSPSTALMPDFVVNSNTSPRPAAANFLEGPHDGDYDYNSCRNPWRIATDFVISGDTRAKGIIQKTNTWIKGLTGGSPSRIVDGYKLAGSAYGGGPSFAFEAPLGVAAMVDSSNRTWLDALWNHLVAGANQGYYEDSIKMQCLLVMSGNWWAP